MNTVVLSNARDCYIELSDPAEQGGEWIVKRYRKRMREMVCLSTDLFKTKNDAVEFANRLKFEHTGYQTAGM